MLVWFLYDIVDNKRRNKVIKMAKEYGLSRVQKSVFLGNITKNRIDEITLQSESIINLKTDSLYIMPMCQADYKEIAANDIRSLSWVKYRIQFRTAFYDMADEIKKGE